MKRKLAILLALALLTGCADDAQTLVETAEQAAIEAAETVEQAAIETAEQTTAVTTDAPSEEVPDISGEIVLTPLEYGTAPQMIPLTQEEFTLSADEADFPELAQVRKYWWADTVFQDESYWWSNEKYASPQCAEELWFEGGVRYDFDGDGIEECVLVLNVLPPDYGPHTSYNGIFYVDSGEVTKLFSGGNFDTQIYLIKGAEYQFLMYDVTAGGMGWSSNIYSFADNKPIAVVGGDRDCISFTITDDGYILAGVKYCNPFYPLILCTDGEIRQLADEEISRDEFLQRLDGADKLLAAYEQEGVVPDGYFTRGGVNYWLTFGEKEVVLELFDGRCTIIPDLEKNNNKWMRIEQELTAESITGVNQYGGSRYLDPDGTLTDSFTERCIELIDPYKISQYNVLPDLWDFERDGVPELIMIYHDSNEGNQTAKVYDVASGECIGEFSGYNRDGYTRFSYDGEDTLVHSFYDAGDFRCDRWDKLRIEDGRLSIIDSELKTAEFDGVSFNWNDDDDLHYSSRFEWCVCGGLEYQSRRAEEYALFEYQSMVNMDNAEILPLLTEKYNSILSLQAAADKLENVIGFYPDDYNNDGKPEAFVQADDLYFISSSLRVTNISEYSGYANYKVEDSLVLQMFSNGMPCEVWSVSAQGEPVRNETASMFMYFDLSEHDSAVYAGFDSAYDGNAVGGHHTWKPYYFVLDNGAFVPLNSKEATPQYLVSEYGEAAQNTLDEITEMGGEVTQIFIRGYGGTMFININYIVPEIIPTIDNDGNETEFCLNHQYYITLKVNGRYLSELERGSGHYSAFNEDSLNKNACERKAMELGGSVWETIEGDGALLAVISYLDAYDYWYFNEGEAQLVLSSTKYGDVGCCIYEENGDEFLVTFERIIGGAMPANIVTLQNGEPLVLSVYDGEGYSRLWWCPYGKIVCERGNGVSAGSVNVIPYHWDSGINDFVPYALTEITKEELRALDTQGVVPDIDSAISVYRRENGLVHVNYAEVYQSTMGGTVTASMTFVQTENGLREYGFDEDMKYGLFLGALSVTGED